MTEVEEEEEEGGGIVLPYGVLASRSKNWGGAAMHSIWSALSLPQCCAAVRGNVHFKPSSVFF